LLNSWLLMSVHSSPGFWIVNSHRRFGGPGTVPDQNWAVVRVGVLLGALKPSKLAVQLAQEAIERAVFQHRDDDVVDVLQSLAE
jgi:hypothetical protein